MRRTTGPLDPSGPLADVVIKAPLSLEMLLKVSGLPSRNGVRAQALIDTGSSSSLVHIGIILALKLKVREIGMLASPTSRGLGQKVERFEVCLSVMMTPSHRAFDPILVGALDLTSYPFKVVLGMDILRHGTFILDGNNGTYTLEF